MPAQVYIQEYSSFEFSITQIAIEWSLSGVGLYVDFHISFSEESLVADLANKRFYSSVHHLDVLGEGKTVDKALATLWADMDLAIGMRPAMPFKTLGGCKTLPTE